MKKEAHLTIDEAAEIIYTKTSKEFKKQAVIESIKNSLFDAIRDDLLKTRYPFGGYCTNPQQVSGSSMVMLGDAICAAETEGVSLR